VRQWLERVPDLRLDGERPTQSTLAQRLGTFWVPGQTLLYVGRTTKSLASRVAGLYATELGYRRPHPGGHWLKTLRDQSRLRLWWAETDAPEEYEDALMSAFAEGIPVKVRDGLGDGAAVLPWANLESPAGLVRDTGLRDALLSADVSPVKPSSVRRSDPSGSIRRRIPSSVPAALRSPRPTGALASGSGAAPAGLRGQPTHLTAEGLADLQAELDRLRNVERPQVVERIKHARELGDLRENADYEAARNEQSFLEGRVLELEQRLRTAVVIRSETRSAISLGSSVRYQSDGQTGELTIVGSTESDPAAGRISAASPVGKALLGRRVGDDVVVTTPTAEIHYHILEIA
jgi:transcription elongation factor GreA